jgi:hypothetical protein
LVRSRWTLRWVEFPATPLHFLAVAPLHFRLPEVFDVTALLLSATAPDLELLILFLAGRPLAHGIWHSFFFVLVILPVATTLLAYVAESQLLGTLKGAYRFFRFTPKKVTYSITMIYVSSLVGGFSHVFFDMWTHRYSSYIIYPLTIFGGENPFWLGNYEIAVQAVVILLSAYMVYQWIKRRAATP